MRTTSLLSLCAIAMSVSGCLGEFEGLAPTGKSVRIQEVAIFRLANGKIVEQWCMPDLHGLLQQLGANGGEEAK